MRHIKTQNSCFFRFVTGFKPKPSGRSNLNKSFSLDVIKKQNVNQRQHAEELQHKHAGSSAHGKKHQHKNQPTHQHIIVNGANHIKISGLLPVPQLNGLGNMETIRYNNA